MQHDIHEKRDSAAAKKRALKLSLVYAIFSAIYIAISDHLVVLVFKDITLIGVVNTIKGWCFVAITASLLYLFVFRQIKAALSLSRSQQQVEEEKLQAISLLESIAINSTDAIFVKDLQGKYLLFNPEVEKITGKSKELMLGKDDTFLFTPEQASQIMANDKKVISENKIISYVETVTTEVGELVYHATKGPLYDLQGNVIGMFGISRNVTEWVNAENLLHQKNQLLIEMSSMAKIGGWEFNIATQKGSWTDEIAKIHDMDVIDDIKVELGLSVFHGEHREKIENAIQQAIELRQSYDLELEMFTTKGNVKWVRTVGMPLIDEGNVVGLHGFMQDITHQKVIEQKLQFWGHAFEYAGFALAISDANTNLFVSVNPIFAKQRGYSVEELVGKPIMMVFPSDVHKEMEHHIVEMQSMGHGIIESKHIRKDGSIFPVLIDLTIIKSPDGLPISRLAYVMDISESKKAEETIHHLAHFDGLTNLPNRVFLTESLERNIAIPSQDEIQNALILLNIDHFKSLIDVQGHNHGDFLLKAIAERLKPLISENDILAKFSGDEFAIFLNAQEYTFNSNVHFSSIVLENIRNALRQAFYIDNDDIYITASLGITLFPEGKSDSAVSVLKRADIALLKAKQNGGNQTIFFESAMGHVAEQYFQTNRELHKAIVAGELKLYLQSQVDSKGTLVGAEALVRWMHPERGLIAPIHFIPIAEDSDLIIDIDNWVLNSVCKVLNANTVLSIDTRISVNISPRHFRQTNFVEGVKNIFLENNINPNRFTFEVTENLIIDNLDDVITKMKILEEMGILMSIDDFGTGYSSLSYLKKLPIHELKIDKVFIQDAPNDADDAALVETILAVARQLKLKVVAEGVETIEQAQFLNERGTVIHQGYLFGRPEPAEDWFKKLENKI